MKKHYPYRFKTEEEFIEEFGECWHPDNIDWSYPEMNYLFGTPFPYDNVIEIRYILGLNSWCVSESMLIKNKRTKPNYKPKTFIYE